MKTVKSLLFSLVIAMGFSSPMVWAGEPNPDAIGNEPSKMKKPIRTVARMLCPAAIALLK